MKLFQHPIFLVVLILSISGCASKQVLLKKNSDSKRSYTVMGKTYYPLKEVRPGYKQDGIASWYGPGFHGKKTSSGEVYDMHEMTAAHNVLPLHTLVKVKNLSNDKEIVVRVNDRGPFVDDRVIDLSLAAAKGLGMVQCGTTPVRISVIGPAEAVASKLPAPVVKAVPTRFPNPFFSTSPKSALAKL
jgi:rare lipoprotein A